MSADDDSDDAARLRKLEDEAGAADLDVAPTRLERPRLTAKLADEIDIVVWATGFKPDHSWLDVDVLDRKGHLRHEGGVVDAPGLYVLGLPLMRRRKSSFIFGIEDDARDITEHLVGYLTTPMRRAS